MVRWLAVVALVAYAFPVAAQTTLGSGGNGTGLGPWGAGDPAVETIGQTFTVPVDNYLTSFSFWFGPAFFPFDNPSFGYRAYLYAWDPTQLRATGSALYVSSPSSYSADASDPYTRQDFFTGGTALVTGAEYVAFLHGSGGSNGDGGVKLEISGGDGYAGGQLVLFDSQGDLTSLTSSLEHWGSGSGSDLHFEARLSQPPVSVPEPESFPLLAGGLVMLGFVGWRRR
jgi:hypothetical protein